MNDRFKSVTLKIDLEPLGTLERGKEGNHAKGKKRPIKENLN
jgi:hypothetical protein